MIDPTFHAQPTAATPDAILDELTRLHGLADGWHWWSGDATADDVTEAIDENPDMARDLAELLPGLAAALDAAAQEIVRLRAEVAGLRVRCGVTP